MKSETTKAKLDQAIANLQAIANFTHDTYIEEMATVTADLISNAAAQLKLSLDLPDNPHRAAATAELCRHVVIAMAKTPLPREKQLTIVELAEAATEVISETYPTVTIAIPGKWGTSAKKSLLPGGKGPVGKITHEIGNNLHVIFDAHQILQWCIGNGLRMQKVKETQ